MEILPNNPYLPPEIMGLVAIVVLAVVTWSAIATELKARRSSPWDFIRVPESVREGIVTSRGEISARRSFAGGKIPAKTSFTVQCTDGREPNELKFEVTATPETATLLCGTAVTVYEYEPEYSQPRLFEIEEA